MTQLIIARHGNTFGPNDTPTRVGARTDIPLVASGIEQARHIGAYFKAQNLIPDVIYTALLKRTQQTAAFAFPEAKIYPLSCFNEIDYGPDENKTEAEVIQRIGQQAIDDWNQSATVPQGWQVSPAQITKDWLDFANMIQEKHKDQIVMVVTSNGIARFAPHITGDFEGFSRQHTLKLKTGALGAFTFKNNLWHTEYWNIKPK